MLISYAYYSNEIRHTLAKFLSAKDSPRSHKKIQDGDLTFQEITKMLCGTWKSLDKHSLNIFEELAEVCRYDIVAVRCAYDINKRSHGYNILLSLPPSQMSRRMYHKRVVEFEEASSTLTSSALVVEGSPKKKMRMMVAAPPTSVMVKQVEQIRMSTMIPQQQKVEQFAAPPQSFNVLTFKTSNATTLDTSRRVSLAASDVGYDDIMYCVTAPMKFPETINLRPSDVDSPVGIVSPISQIDMDFDTFDTTFDLNNNDFDKLFDLEDQDSSSSGNVDDDLASCSSITDDDMSMECDAFDLPFSPVVNNKMEEAQPEVSTSREEPSVDDFLKLIAQLDDNLPSYPMASAA